MYGIYWTIVLVILSSQRGFFGNGLLCYDCRSDSSFSKCISEIGEPRSCEKKYCTIYRREYLDPPGKIQHFYRSCEDSPTYLNTIVQAPSYKTYYRACDENLCNLGDGLVTYTKAVVSGNLSGTEIFLVPGIGSSGQRSYVLFNGFFVSGVTALTIVLR